MSASLPAVKLEAGRSEIQQTWQGPRQADLLTDTIERSWEEEKYHVYSADGILVQDLIEPGQYLCVMETQILPNLDRRYAAVHRPWTAAFKQAFAELKRLRQPGSDPESWAEFGFKVPDFTPDDRLLSVKNSWPRPIKGAPRLRPKEYWKQIQPAEAFFTPSEIAEEGFVLVRGGNPQGWLCYDVPAHLQNGVNNVTVPMMYGRALRAGDDAAVRAVRDDLRKNEAEGAVIPWHRESEVAEFGGTLAIPIWRVHNGSVYNITKYLPHHPAAYSILEQWGGRDITTVFNNSHPHALTVATTGPAKTAVRQVGRLVPAQSAGRADQVALGDYVFALADLSVLAAVQARWAGQAVRPEQWAGAQDAPVLDLLYDRRRAAAVGKYVPAQPAPDRRFSMKQLEAHEERARCLATTGHGSPSPKASAGLFTKSLVRVDCCI
ncbi:cytochrome b5-like Heme/Steroid binding domain-containing protein [Apiospora hydei]|uniref:Cytochrome b5-like Heme/Steroid binding domain-containing protein n=1 Tax=Apiospora hydei TaxID=1337664 RepID=A0ABR1WS25_9PEZI